MAITDVTRALFKPIPFREVFVILALFLPQLTFAEGAKLDGKLWYSPSISREESMVHVAQGLQGMREYRIAFATHSRAAAFVSPEQPVHSFESLATLPSEHIHIGSQVGRVYRMVLREDHRVFALLMVLLEYVTQPKKKSRQGSNESKEELAVIGRVAQGHGRWLSFPPRRLLLPCQRKLNLVLTHRSNGHSA